MPRNFFNIDGVTPLQLDWVRAWQAGLPSNGLFNELFEKPGSYLRFDDPGASPWRDDKRR